LVQQTKMYQYCHESTKWPYDIPKYPEWPWNISKFAIPRPLNMHWNRRLWFTNEPSGNPV
jgi:hypothetical protein